MGRHGCRFIKEGGSHERRRLDEMVMYRPSAATPSPERKLDVILTSVLRNALRGGWARDELEEFCRTLNEVLGTFAVVFSSLAAPGLTALLSRSDNVIFDMLSDLHSILDVPNDPNTPIRPQHASVRDYLFEIQRCSDARFWVEERHAHSRSMRQCLLLMTKT
jgi:hypothetical protein